MASIYVKMANANERFYRTNPVVGSTIQLVFRPPNSMACWALHIGTGGTNLIIDKGWA